MIVRLVVMGAVALLAVLLDTVALAELGLGVWQPDLVMMTVMAFALAEGSGTGARYGFAAGLLVDLLASGSGLLGTSALVFVLVGYALGAARPYLTGGLLGARVVAVAATSVLAVLAGTLLAYLLEATSAGVFTTIQSALATGAIHALLTPVVILPLEGLSRVLPKSTGERAESVWQRS